MYNLNELHNPDYDYNNVKPYRSPEFPSIYKGLTMEIHIVDHCNLNCAGCNHFSPLAKPWYISIDDFTLQLTLLRDNIPTVQELLLLGGEPLLHPQFIELCIIARKIFPDIRIRVLSNGIKINLTDSDLQSLKEYDILIDFCNYPGYTDIETIQNISAPMFATRSILHQVLVDESGQQDADYNFYNCNKYRLPCLTLRDSKIFICPFIAHLHHYMNKANINYELQKNVDYLDIKNINNNLDILQDFCFTPKAACKYCKQENVEWIWHASHRDLTEYNTPLYELYLKDYKRYYDIVNNHFNYFLKCYDPNNPKPIDPVYGVDFNQKLIKRLGYGAIDIIIPHYNLSEECAINLINTLTNQSIINDCVVYFISDNSQDEKYLINLIINSNLNYVLLKLDSRQGPGAARNYGLIHSFNKYKFFLDADDYFYNNEALALLYAIGEQGGHDLIQFYMYSNNPLKNGNKANFLITQDLLKNNNIKYNNLYFGEDLVFQAAITSAAQNCYNFNNKIPMIAIYNQKNDGSLTNELKPNDTNHFNYLTSKLLSCLYDIDLEFFINYIYFNLILLEHQEKILFKQDFPKVFLHWLHYQIYKLHPQFYEICAKEDYRIIDFKNNIFYITTTNDIITNEQDCFLYIQQYIENIYLNNSFTAAAANYILNYS